MRTSRTLIAVVAMFLLLSVLPAQAAGKRRTEVWTVTGDAGVMLTGHGYGHGRGLSQHGAQGAALQGLTWRQIAEFYYPGTQWGQARGRMRVLLTADTTPDLQVVARPGITVRSLKRKRTWQLPERRARKWRLLGSARRTKVQFTRGGGWRTWKTFPGEAQFASARGPLTLVLPGNKRARYRGILRSTAAKPGQRRQTVNLVPMEAYLRGVVPQEIPALWHQEAVAAQSIAARTYAAFERTRPAARHYDLCDTTLCQVYGGVDAEHEASDAAIRSTAGEVLTYEGAPAFTQFSSSSGGWTAAGSMPYLVAQEDPYDGFSGNRVHTWSHVINDGVIEKHWPEIGDLTSIQVLARDGNGEWGGRVVDMAFVGTAGEVRVSGDSVRSTLGLRSSWFTFTVMPRRAPRIPS
jgi:stage II sporulation protein D